MRYRQAGQTGHPVTAGTVDKALLAVGEGISSLDQPDPRKQTAGASRLHPLLTDFLKGLRDEDDPPSRAYPANITIIKGLLDALDTDHHRFGHTNRTVIDLIIVAFFWLLRPAEYLKSSSPEARSQAFRFQDIHLTIDGVVYNAPTAPLNDETDIQRVTHACLQFTDQKNAVRGEQIGQAATSDPFWCGAKALARLAYNLKRYNATPDTPIHVHYNPDNQTWYDVPPLFMTNALQHSVRASQEQTGINPDLLSAG